MTITLLVGEESARAPEAPESARDSYAGLKPLLPKLAQPFWYRLVGQSFHDAHREESPEARKVRLRKERKADRRRKAGVGMSGLVAAMNVPKVA